MSPRIKNLRAQRAPYFLRRREQLSDGGAIIRPGDIAQEQGANHGGEFRVFVHLRHDRATDDDFAPRVEFASLRFFLLFESVESVGEFFALLFEVGNAF